MTLPSNLLSLQNFSVGVNKTICHPDMDYKSHLSPPSLLCYPFYLFRSPRLVHHKWTFDLPCHWGTTITFPSPCRSFVETFHQYCYSYSILLLKACILQSPVHLLASSRKPSSYRRHFPWIAIKPLFCLLAQHTNLGLISLIRVWHPEGQDPILRHFYSLKSNIVLDVKCFSYSAAGKLKDHQSRQSVHW